MRFVAPVPQEEIPGLIMKWKDVQRSTEPWNWKPICRGMTLHFARLVLGANMGRIATLEDVNNAQNGRIIGDIPLNDVYWSIIDRFRRGEELTMDEQRELEIVTKKDVGKLEDVLGDITGTVGIETGTFSSGPVEGQPKPGETIPKEMEIDLGKLDVGGAVIREEQHQDIDPSELEKVEQEELGEDDEFEDDDEENGDEDDEDEDLDDAEKQLS